MNNKNCKYKIKYMLENKITIEKYHKKSKNNDYHMTFFYFIFLTINST